MPINPPSSTPPPLLKPRSSRNRFLHSLNQIERDFGRDRAHSIPNGPRTLDLDLLLYGNRIISTPVLELPHPRMLDRTFVLIPLAEIASNVIHPKSLRSVKQSLHDLQDN